MGKARKWLRSFFTGKKAKEKGRDSNPDRLEETRSSSAPVAATKEKRWSFRRSAGATKDLHFAEASSSEPCPGLLEIDQRRRAMAVAVATAAAAEAAVVAAQAAAAFVRLTAAGSDGSAAGAIEEASAIKIQSFFRSYLARKALNALKGLVKMQALVRGHLVRKKAKSTLRSMQALVKAQNRARAERIRMAEASQSTTQRQQSYRRSPHHPFDCNEEEYVKIVEMDHGGRSSYKSLGETERTDQWFSAYNPSSRQFSPSPSALMSPRAHSGHYEEFSFATTQNSPQLSAMSTPAAASFDHPPHPNYMANTESSRAKLRSQSAPKQRLEAYERESSKKRQVFEGRNVPWGIRMQRSSSLYLTGNGYELPWPTIKLDKSDMSLIESECGSTSSNKNCCRSPAAYEEQISQNCSGQNAIFNWRF